MVTILNLKKGEGKNFKFTIKDDAGAAIDVTSATITFSVKRKKTDDDDEIVIQKLDASFDKTDAANGIVSVPLTTTDTDITAGKYYAELKTAFSSSATDKSDDIIINIIQDVY